VCADGFGAGCLAGWYEGVGEGFQGFFLAVAFVLAGGQKHHPAGDDEDSVKGGAAGYWHAACFYYKYRLNG
jgi:hypothetical protein